MGTPVGPTWVEDSYYDEEHWIEHKALSPHHGVPTIFQLYLRHPLERIGFTMHGDTYARHFKEDAGRLLSDAEAQKVMEGAIQRTYTMQLWDVLRTEALTWSNVRLTHTQKQILANIIELEVQYSIQKRVQSDVQPCLDVAAFRLKVQQLVFQSEPGPPFQNTYLTTLVEDTERRIRPWALFFHLHELYWKNGMPQYPWDEVERATYGIPLHMVWVEEEFKKEHFYMFAWLRLQFEEAHAYWHQVIPLPHEWEEGESVQSMANLQARLATLGLEGRHHDFLTRILEEPSSMHV
jgi:hypothetical protein